MGKGVLVIGSGVGGMKAALEAAGRAERVYLVERSPFLGGEITFLERQFPTDRCCMCQMLPTSQRFPEGEYCLRRSFYHPRVEVLTCSEVLSLEGKEGDFQVALKIGPRGVREELCNACGKCLEACPREGKDEFYPFSTRRAIYLRGPEPIPPIPVIDWELCDRCGRCVDVCPTGAIDLSAETRERTLQVSSVILATGFTPFDPRPLTQYGYGRFPNVVTSLEFERMLSPLGLAKPMRPSDHRVARRIAFLLCVGSRQRDWEPCSTACCMIALKQARLTLEAEPVAEPVLFFMDLRAFGKGYHRYLEEAKERGVRFLRGRVPKVWEDPRTKDLILRFMDREGVKEEAFDLVVLMTGQRPPEGFAGLVRRLGLEADLWGFVKAKGVRTTRPGVFVCGPASGPKDIPETILEATAAALEATRGVPSRRVQGPLPLPEEGYPEKVALVLCRCGGDLPAEGIATALRDVFSPLLIVDYLCQEVPDLVADRIVLGACAPYWFKRKVLGFLRGDSWKVEWVNIKGILQGQGGCLDTVRKALLGARKKVLKITERSLEPWEAQGRVLVLGGGFCGLKVAIELASRGIGVSVVEKGDRLGGAYRNDPLVAEEIERAIASLYDLKGVEVYTQARLKELRGTAGDFEAVLEVGGEIRGVPVGAVIVATGAKAYIPEGYLYNQNPRVMTQTEFRRALSSGGVDPQGIRSVVMVQCVNQRDERRPWCSRFCCEEAIRNALLFKDLNPQGEIYVVHRDVMTYGLKEALYVEARARGVVFLREEGKVEVEALDRVRVKGRDFLLEGDLLVLSVGEEPPEDIKGLSKVLGIPLTPEGFLQEAEPKFRPVDAVREGIYLCGGCKGPRTFEEAEVEAMAAVQRALALLEGEVHLGVVASYVDERRCSGCGLCVEACPYGARALDQEGKVARVRTAICQGCGVCSALCPNGAAKLFGFEEGQVFGVLESMVSRR